MFIVMFVLGLVAIWGFVLFFLLFPDEFILPFVLLYRVIRGQLTFRIAWRIFDSWLPFKFVRRCRAEWRIWKARRYRGNDEFHPSLDMDVWSMMQLSPEGVEAYLEDLNRRRARVHDMEMGRKTVPVKEKMGFIRAGFAATQGQGQAGGKK
jgi:hypothetical protein